MDSAMPVSIKYDFILSGSPITSPIKGIESYTRCEAANHFIRAGGRDKRFQLGHPRRDE